jgi:hypothetical protein
MARDMCIHIKLTFSPSSPHVTPLNVLDVCGSGFEFVVCSGTSGLERCHIVPTHFEITLQGGNVAFSAGIFPYVYTRDVFRLTIGALQNNE